MSVVLTSQDPKTKYNERVAADRGYCDYAELSTILRLVRAANALGRGYQYRGESTPMHKGIQLAFKCGLIHLVDENTEYPQGEGYWVR
jgi:hypothetical protein